MDRQDFQKWVHENLLTKPEAMSITKQTLTSFNQSIATGQLQPFYDHGEGRFRTRLYLKDDVVVYAEKVAERRKRLEK